VAESAALRAKPGLPGAGLWPRSWTAAPCRLEHGFAASGGRDTKHTSLYLSSSFAHRGSGEVVMCLSAQAMPFLRQSSEGGDLVNAQLTALWGTKEREVFGLRRHLPLSADSAGHLHGSGALHQVREIEW